MRFEFQMIGGSVQMTKITSSEYKPGRRNSRRRRGTSASTAMTETSSSAFVYLQRNPRPMRKPVNGHHQVNFGLCSSVRQKADIAATQQKTESGSVVMTKPPMLKIGTAFIAITSQKAVTSLKSRRAK